MLRVRNDPSFVRCTIVRDLMLSGNTCWVDPSWFCVLKNIVIVLLVYFYYCDLNEFSVVVNFVV